MRLVALWEGGIMQEKLRTNTEIQKASTVGGVERKKRFGRPALNQRRAVAVDK